MKEFDSVFDISFNDKSTNIDVDSETYKDIFEKNDTIDFSIVGTSEIKEPPMY